jgi:septum formation protein
MGKNQSLTLPYPLILASTSKYRGELLSQLGLPFTAVAPGVDEDAYKTYGISPLELSRELAFRKAEAVFERYPHALVIGSDQVCTLEGEILSKPGTVAKAIAQLLKMQGKHHELVTAVCLMMPHKKICFENRTRLYMRQLTEESVREYVQLDSPLDCAGSYKLESRGIKLFEKIEMDDHTSIIGLPLIQLNNHLLELGYPL